jgi:hypothetical protein
MEIMIHILLVARSISEGMKRKHEKYEKYERNKKVDR